MLSERYRNLLSTIRIRLVLWMIVVVFGLVMIAMFGVRQLYRNRLLEEFDQGLQGDVKVISQEVHQFYPNPDWTRLKQSIDKIAFAHPLQAWFVEIYDESGRKLAACGHDPKLEPFNKHESASAHDSLPYRLIVAKIEESGLPVLYFRIGADRQSMEDDLSLLDRSMLARSLIILLLAPLGGYILALRATRPIAKIIATATRLQPSQLHERLPIRGTDDEIDQLSKTINGMLDRIADYIDRNREFVANAAHELRSPLAAIRSSVEVALNRQRSPEEYGTLLGEVMEECQYLSNLVNRLLILAEGDAGRLGARNRTTRLDKIVRESIDMFEAVADSHDVRLTISGLTAAVVPGDEFHVRQVVRNLLDNAIKFSPPGSQVDVTLRADAEQSRAVLTVRDQGVGIPAADLPHIFERFFRGDKSRQREPGRTSSGLGLSICQSIVQALEGGITVASQVGAGSTFTVTLPLAEQPPSRDLLENPAA